MKKEIGIFVLLMLLCITLAILNPNFLGSENMQNMARRIGMFGIFSIGMGIIIITGGIDLSVGSMFALQGVLLSMMLREWHYPWYVAVGAIILGTMILGLFHGFFITKVRMQPFIVTLCGLLFYRGMAQTFAHNDTKGFGFDSYGMLRTLATGTIHGIPMPFILLAIILIVMWVVLHRTVYGRYLFAVGRNSAAARYSGINDNLIIASAYVLSAALCAISGILFAFDTNSVSPKSHGSFYELYGIAAAVLGGCSLRGGEGSILGILIGVILLQVLRNLVNLLGIPDYLDFVVMGGVIFLGVLFDQLFLQRQRTRVKTAAEAAPAVKI